MLFVTDVYRTLWVSVYRLMKQSHVWNRGSYICIQVLLHIICLTFVNYYKLLNTKTAYFSFIKTKIKLFLYFYSQKWTAPRLLSYVDNSLSCSRRDMLYQEVQGDSEWMYIFTSQSFGTQWILKHPPRNQLISCWENENYFLVSNNPSMQIS